MIAELVHFILMPIVWLPIVGVLGYLTYKNYKKINQLKTLNLESVLLMLEIPKNNDKKELSAEQMFASLHGILKDTELLRQSGTAQEHLSFEIVSSGGQIRFYVYVPKTLQSFVEGQIYAQYPSVQIHVVDKDYTETVHSHNVVYTSELSLTENEVLPIKTFDTFEVDPLAGITGTLAKLNPDSNEELWIQILTRPVADSWHQKTDTWVKAQKNPASSLKLFNIDWTWLAELLSALSTPPSGGSGSPKPAVELSERVKSQISAAETKATKLGYQVKIRLAYLGDSEINAQLDMQALVGTFKQYNSTNLNGFKSIGGSFNREDLETYKLRQFTDEGFILNISELASVYHLPHTSVETPNIVWATSKTAEPPAKLPLITGIASNDENISAFGLTNFRGINHQFGMLRRDRSRHIYIIGQTGAGKSGLLELFALSDVFYNQGYCIIDPHGDFAVNNLRFVPASRVKDVIYFNPADTQYPVGFNPLEVSDASKKPNVCSEVIGVLKRMFGDSWGPRLEHILRYTLLALLDRPETTLLDISRLLTDKEFRKETLDYCTDVTVLQFWKHEFGQWNDKQINESIAPVLNKVGAFTANPIIRNIIGQPKSTFNVRQIMDEGKILVVNLSKGLIGEDNAGILGAFLVTKIQLAAMSRSDIPEVENRRPFYLYVDEFQNFATDSFAVILSEARKYGLNLTVANQYISQMTENVRNAVFGNVGTTISFRVSADDAPILSKQFAPVFDESDLIQMNNRHFVISMIIGGEKVPAFSATTLNIPHSPHDNFDQIIAHSREYYSHPRAEIERQIRETIEQSEKYKQELSNSGRQPADKAPRENLPTLTFINGKPSMSAKPFDAKKFSPNTVTNQAKPGLKDLKEILEAKTATHDQSTSQTQTASQGQTSTQNQMPIQSQTTNQGSEQGNTPLFVNHGASTSVVTQNSTPISAKNSAPTSTPVSTSVNSPVSPNDTQNSPEAPEQASQPNTANQPESAENHAQATENALNSAPSTSLPNQNSGTHESHTKPQGNRNFKNRNFRSRNNFKKKGNKPTSVSGPKPTPIN